jgi:hypothetical protein
VEDVYLHSFSFVGIMPSASLDKCCVFSGSWRREFNRQWELKVNVGLKLTLLVHFLLLLDFLIVRANNPSLGQNFTLGFVG